MGAVIAALILCRMNMNLIFFIASILLGVGLAMDAFAISIANGISRPDAKCRYVMKIYSGICILSICNANDRVVYGARSGKGSWCFQ